METSSSLSAGIFCGSLLYNLIKRIPYGNKKIDGLILPCKSGRSTLVKNLNEKYRNSDIMFCELSCDGEEAVLEEVKLEDVERPTRRQRREMNTGVVNQKTYTKLGDNRVQYPVIKTMLDEMRKNFPKFKIICVSNDIHLMKYCKVKKCITLAPSYSLATTISEGLASKDEFWENVHTVWKSVHIVYEDFDQLFGLVCRELKLS